MACIYFFTLAVGCLFWVLVHHATDAEWSVLVRRVLENVAILVPVTLLFFIPAMLLRRAYLELVGHPGGMSDSLLDRKRWYLSHGFFFVRFLIYFAGLSAGGAGSTAEFDRPGCRRQSRSAR